MRLVEMVDEGKLRVPTGDLSTGASCGSPGGIAAAASTRQVRIRCLTITGSSKVADDRPLATFGLLP